MAEERSTPDVNTEQGFNEALAASAGRELSSDDLAKIEALKGSDRSIAAGLETPESTRPRDDAGRFVATPEAPAPAAPTPAAPVTPVEGAAPPAEQEDPVAKLLAEYDGDANKALAAQLEKSANLESVLGRQGEELGSLRQLPEQLAELRGRVEGMAQTAPAAAPQPFVSAAQIGQAFSESDDPDRDGPAIMEWVVENAPDMIEQTVRVWKDYDPVGAADFAARKAFYEEVEKNKATPPASVATPDPWVEAQKFKEAIGGAVASSRKDIPDAEWEKLRPIIADEITKAPEFLKKAIAEESSRAEALGEIIAKSQARFTRESTAAVAAAAAADAVAGKQAATVLTGSLQSPVVEVSPTGERTPEEVSKALRDALLATDTTDVASGLTYGKSVPQVA
jgi:hypothetical protein